MRSIVSLQRTGLSTPPLADFSRALLASEIFLSSLQTEFFNNLLVYTSLVWCFRNPLNHLGVIPGKLAIPPEADQPQAEASATRNPEKQKLLDTLNSRV